MSDLQPQNHQSPQGYVPQGYAPQGYPPGWSPQQNPQQFQNPNPYGYLPPDFVPRETKPGTVVAASVMWIIYGSLGMLGNLFTMAQGLIGPSTFISVGLALMFLITGIQAISGKARGVLGVGITSIVLGGIVGIAFLFLGTALRGMGGGGAGIILLIGMVFAGFLITAGILACVGNRGYKNWRMTKGLY